MTNQSNLKTNRSRWTIVGVQNSVRESNPETKATTSRRLFKAVSSQIDRIVDTMSKFT